MAIVVCSVLFVGLNAGSVDENPWDRFADSAAEPPGDREPLAPSRSGMTVFTSSLASLAVEGEPGHIVALNPNGTIRYYNNSRDAYWDVDPSPVGEETVVYAATDEVHDTSRCRPTGPKGFCIRQMIARANLTTGETTVLYSRIDSRYRSSEWHDIDHVSGANYAVADMHNDGVFIVNTTTGVVEWSWSLQSYLPLETGGPYPDNWAHLNDVEVLEDGRILASLRNQDQVVFIDRETGVEQNWTLGADDNYSVLHEQHNPDYITADDGGPALLVADSENTRLVEYQRTDRGTWRRTWTWQDSTVQWPRDADRLPNGHTLVTDTHGGRIVELDRQGAPVWTLDVPAAYEAERLDTGEESAGGPSAVSADLESYTYSASGDDSGESSAGVVTTVRVALTRLVPNKVVNGIAFVLPFWVDFFDAGLLLVVLGAALSWTGTELKWRVVDPRRGVTAGSEHGDATEERS